MEPRWTVTQALAYDENVEFGPSGDRLPRAFGASVDYVQAGAKAELSGTFDGQRIVVTRFNVCSEAVTPRMLRDLTLADVVHDVGHRLLRLGAVGAIDTRTRPWRGGLDAEMLVVATLYWREHATWGAPLKAIQQTWDLPDQTAHHWRRRALARYGSPD